MGEIVFWTIIRAAVVVPIIWISRSYLDYQLWFLASAMVLYGVIVHPAVVHYRLFIERNKEIMETTLCSSCRFFERSAVLCSKFDEHPTKDYLPCEGLSWEPVVHESALKDS